MSESRDRLRSLNRKLNDEIRRLRAFANITQRKNEDLTKIHFGLNAEIADLKRENDRLTVVENIKVRSVSFISPDSYLYSNVPFDKAEEFAKRNAMEGLLHSLRELVEIKVEDDDCGNKVITAEITVKRPLNEEYKGRMVFR